MIMASRMVRVKSSMAAMAEMMPGPAQTHVIGVGLVAGGEAAACVSGEQDRAHGKSGKEGCLGNFGVGFHDFFLLQMLSDGWQEKQKTFRRSCRLAEETKGRKPSAVPLFFVSCIGNTLNGIPSYPCYCNGSSRLHLLSILTQPLYSQFGSLIALCLAPTGTSLRGSPCLLLCVIAFVMVG